jgi:hypothetical protein
MPWAFMRLAGASVAISFLTSPPVGAILQDDASQPGEARGMAKAVGYDGESVIA